MLPSRIACLPVLLVVMASKGFPEKGPSIENRRPATVAQRLQEKHVPLTTDSLVNALGSPDPEIRFLAAEELATKDAKDQIPQILNALNKEQVGLTRVNIALALGQLGAGEGIEALEKSCIDSRLPADLRVLATRYTLYLKNRGCIAALQNMLQPSTDSQARIQAFHLLRGFPGSDISQTDLDLVVLGLRDSNPAVRIASAETLRFLHTTSAVPDLKTAIATESDEAVKSEMQNALKQLQAAGTSDLE